MIAVKHCNGKLFLCCPVNILLTKNCMVSEGLKSDRLKTQAGLKHWNSLRMKEDCYGKKYN